MTATADAAFVPAAEAAFLAGVSDSDLNRMVDEDIVPRELVRLSAGRRFSRLCAAFAAFYLNTDDRLAASWRRHVLRELTGRIIVRPDRDDLLQLRALSGDFSWIVVDGSFMQVDLREFVDRAAARVAAVEQARERVSVDPGVMAGRPVFRGTRVPIETALASLDTGDTLEQLREGWPFLTPAHIDAARVYLTVNPRRGRPRRMGEANPKLRLVERRVLRPAGVA